MNRKLIIGGGVVVLVFLGFYALSRASISNAWLDGEKDQAKLGNLIIPVTATGTVQANRFVTIKSKASGQVSKIHVVEGQKVEAGQVLVELDPVDEKRRLESSQADLDRAKSVYEKTKIALENQQLDLPLQTAQAESRLLDATARLEDAEFRWNKMRQYLESDVAGDVEGVSTKATYLAAKAAKDLAEADLERAKNNERIVLHSAEQDVIQAEASATSAQKLLDEAKLRLEETTVRARNDGMVYNIVVQQGEMIQSGTSGFTGGTPIMTLADVSSVYVMAQVDEADIGAIRKIAPDYARPGTSTMLSDEEYARRAEERLKELEGKGVEVTVEAYRAETFQGVIERILPEPQRVNNALAFNVRVRLVGDDLKKLIGLQADLSFTTEKLEDVVLVKNDALFSEGRDCFVYIPIKKSSGRWGEEKRPVKIGVTDGTYTEIVSGLKPDDEIWVKRPKETDREKRESST
jgi:multidrug efflux pump subunit AcrA (membrane-fusion protein)